MEYKILQVKDIRNCDYLFMHYDFAKEHGFTLDDYKVVYEGHIEPEDITRATDVYDYLEHLFYVFNCERPQDFKGHSLSVSDVIELDGKHYYCDSIGYKQLD